jgi:hypothetical protein
VAAGARTAARRLVSRHSEGCKNGDKGEDTHREVVGSLLSC